MCVQICLGMNTNDRERIASLWRDLLRVFFNMPVHFLYGGSTSSADTSVTNIDPASSAFTGDLDSIPIDNSEAFQAGAYL